MAMAISITTKQTMKNLIIISAFFLLSQNVFSQSGSGLRINEIVSTNSFLLSDLNNLGDWIEIYNPTANPIDLGGYFITDDYANLTKYQIPTGNPDFIIPSGGFFLVWADDSTQGVHANFKLSSAGEKFALVESNGATITDSISFPALVADYSWGRTIDGSGTWVEFNNSSTTPASSNQATSVGVGEGNGNYFKVISNGSEFPLVNFFSGSPNYGDVNWFNINGQCIFKESIVFSSGKNIIQTPTGLVSGLYLVKVSINEFSFTQKIIIN
jgi:hypothetical protein